MKSFQMCLKSCEWNHFQMRVVVWLKSKMDLKARPLFGHVQGHADALAPSPPRAAAAVHVRLHFGPPAAALGGLVLDHQVHDHVQAASRHVLGLGERNEGHMCGFGLVELVLIYALVVW